MSACLWPVFGYECVSFIGLGCFESLSCNILHATEMKKMHPTYVLYTDVSDTIFG